MFARLSTLALALPLVSAISITNLGGTWVPGNNVTLGWTSSSGDATTFSVEVVGAVLNQHIFVANDVPTSQGTTSFIVPQLPIGSYTLAFVNISNETDVYATSGSFTVANATTSSTTSASSSSTVNPSSGTSGASGASGTASSSAASASASATKSSGGFRSAGIAPVAGLALSMVAGAAVLF